MRKKNKFYALWISLICIIIFILQNLVDGFTEIFMLSEKALTMPWQFFTAIFLHGSTVHLVYNLFALIIFGLILETIIGSKRFLILFITSGVIVNIISWPWFPNALGASGAIMAVIGTLAILKPLMSVWAFGMIIPMFIAAIIWAIGSFLGVFGLGDQGIGHLAHLGGIIIGLFYGAVLRSFARNKRQYQSIFKRQINLPEKEMRHWEDTHIDDR